MPTVEVNGDLSHALNVFKRKTAEEGVMGEYKRRQEYSSPCEKHSFCNASVEGGESPTTAAKAENCTSNKEKAGRINHPPDLCNILQESYFLAKKIRIVICYLDN